MNVAIVTDSASDLSPEAAAAAGITVVPLIVSFGQESFRAGVDLTTDEFWARMTAPDAPFPTTAASGPGVFLEAFKSVFAGGADAIVCVNVAGALSGTLKSAQIARDELPEREIHVVDSQTASMAIGILAKMGVALARDGVAPAEIAATLERRVPDLRVLLTLETLEYLRRGGRISGAQAMIGGLLNIKPIIEVVRGEVAAIERVRTRSKARERMTELIFERPVEQLVALHTLSPDIEAFRDGLAARAGLTPGDVPIEIVGASVGPHVGPGCVGAIMLYAPA